jgi:hypothetical protein
MFKMAAIESTRYVTPGSGVLYQDRLAVGEEGRRMRGSERKGRSQIYYGCSGCTSASSE